MSRNCMDSSPVTQERSTSENDTLIPVRGLVRTCNISQLWTSRTRSRRCSAGRTRSAPIRRSRTTAAATPRCKATGADPVTGDPVEVLFVKGSGGDLGTLTRPGLAVLRPRPRAGAACAVPRSRARGRDGRRSSSTARFGARWRGAVDRHRDARASSTARHVDHLHPDAVIALAAAPDGEALTKECFGGEVAWVPWRRPGFELGARRSTRCTGTTRACAASCSAATG